MGGDPQISRDELEGLINATKRVPTMDEQVQANASHASLTPSVATTTSPMYATDSFFGNPYLGHRGDKANAAHKRSLGKTYVFKMAAMRKAIYNTNLWKTRREMHLKIAQVCVRARVCVRVHACVRMCVRACLSVGRSVCLCMREAISK